MGDPPEREICLLVSNPVKQKRLTGGFDYVVSLVPIPERSRTDRVPLTDAEFQDMLWAWGPPPNYDPARSCSWIGKKVEVTYDEKRERTIKALGVTDVQGALF